MQEEVRWRRVSFEGMLQEDISLSAGAKPSRDINPLAMKVMKEVGIDISNQKSKVIIEDMMRNSAKIVSMGCMDSHLSNIIYPPSNRLENRRS